MRKVTAGLFHSVDGVVEAPNLWQYDSFDAEMGAEMGAFIGSTDAGLLGRVAYDEWSGYWVAAGQSDPFAGFINPLKKYVASTTLTGPLSWQNSELIEGDLLDFVTALKATDGGDIAVLGGFSLTRQLLFGGLLDSLTLMTHPVIAGSGRRLFEPGDPETRLTLESCTATSAGNVITRYRRRD
jgi:dihydrofolate reductase